MFQDDYYVIESENNDNYPMFSWDQLSGNFGMGTPVKFKAPVMMRLGDPISPNFEWVDYHVVSAPVVSTKIADALRTLDIYGIQLVPAQVRNPKDSSAEPKDYWFVHVWNRISCMDNDNSEIRTNKSGTRIFAIDKLALNKEVLDKIELKERLIFELAEKTSVLLVHQTIKDAIESTNPKGCRFFKASDWRSDIAFD